MHSLQSEEPASNPYRIALSVQGAVALGAYQAGVLSQLYADTCKYNEIRGDRRMLAIDALAGASAGAVTAVLLARAISLGLTPDQLEEQMKDVWIESLDIENLLEDLYSKDNAIFHSGIIERLGDKHLGEHTPATQMQHEHIGLWITLTNLSGIPYMIDLDDGSRLYSTMHRDYAPFIVKDGVVYDVNVQSEILDRLQGVESFTHSTWDAARQAAVASAAFPLAFKSRSIKRSLRGYRLYRNLARSLMRRDETIELPQREGWIDYVDGGVLNNQPIGRAIQAAAFANQLNNSPVVDNEDKNRTYLIIEPNPKTEKFMKDWESRVSAESREFGMGVPATLGGVMNAYFEESLYSDLNQALKTNETFRKLEDVDGVSEEFLRAANLYHKHIVNIELLPGSVSDDRFVAGAGLNHFGGFLSSRLREHDFELGQKEARQWFQKLLREKLVEPGDPIHSEFPDLSPPARPEPAEFSALSKILVRGILLTFNQFQIESEGSTGSKAVIIMLNKLRTGLIISTVLALAATVLLFWLAWSQPAPTTYIAASVASIMVLLTLALGVAWHIVGKLLKGAPKQKAKGKT